MEKLSIRTSEQINEIIAALAKVQSELKPAVFNKVNPHFKTRYADFTSCMEACRQPLAKNGLAVSQIPSTSEDGKLVLVTFLAHTSGQWLSGEFPLISSKMDSQGIGSAMTYAKRYSLCGMIGIVSDEEVDDDGEAASGRVQIRSTVPTRVESPLKINASDIGVLKNLEGTLDEGCKMRIREWMEKQFKISDYAQVTVEMFPKVKAALDGAVRYMEQKEMAGAA